MAIDPMLASATMSAQTSPRLEPQQWQDDGLSQFWNNVRPSRFQRGLVTVALTTARTQFLLPGFGNEAVHMGQMGYTADDAWQMPNPSAANGAVSPGGPFDLNTFGLHV
jgi:hypothetical protein